jgi:hypothetical protein
MDAQLMEALAEILADALLADLEADLESGELLSLTASTAPSPTGSGSKNSAAPDVSSGVSGIAAA